MDTLIQTGKGRHIRTADLLRSAAKLLREPDVEASRLRRLRKAELFERLATELENVEAGRQANRMTDEKLRKLIEQGTEW